MKPEFVHLHCHTEYSLLDGLPHPRHIAEKARQFGQPAVALTDHGAMFAAIEFHDACRGTGVKPILGMESYLARRSRFDRDSKQDRDSLHLLLLAQDGTGYRNLMRLATAAQLEGFYYYPRVDKELLEKYNQGLIVTSGCLSAEIPDHLKNGRLEQARQALTWYRDVFGDRFYIELQDHNIPELTQVNRTLMQFAREFDLPLVATNDVHYLNRADAFAQDILLCIQTNKVFTDPDRMRMTSDDYYFKSTEEMAAIWREVPEALANTLVVAERCNVDLSTHGYHLPVFPVPEGYTAESYLRLLCEAGLGVRFPDLPAESRKQMEYELGVIHQMGFDTYFLIVWDLTRYAREQNIWYNVRGSAAGSIVAYCLGITNLDPLPHHLVFERFLNPGRISMPDIDLDFPDDGRGQMIEYTVNKYGRETVAQIITFGKLLAKAAIRDVGRALDYPLGEVDRVAKLIPVGPGQTIESALEKIPEFRELYDTSDYLHKLIDTARLLEGVTRHASTHAAGVVVADQPIIEYTPLHRPTRGDVDTGFPVTQFSMGDLEHIGLLKIDFLGLATLTIMRRVCELVEKRYGVHYDLSNIPVEDPKAFELLSRGDVQGVFQVEGAGMRRVLTGMQPTKFDHIVATISLFRPGPMESIPTYIRRMHGEEPVRYDHPSLEPILAETYGVLVYQEQIIRTAMIVCGYSGPEADVLRKAVGKKNKEVLLAHREKFVAGANSHGGVPTIVAEKLFDDLAEFARYGFNKAHAADYAVLTCQTAFLKAHYPLEYMSALLTNEIGNLDKIASLVAEARRAGLKILPPDVRCSDVLFAIDYEENGIRFGLSAIKNVGEGPARIIAEARRAGEPFNSLDDFCRRVDLRQVNRRVLESLIRAGALDTFGDRAQLLAVVDRMLTVSQRAHSAQEQGQLSFFGGGLIQSDTFGTLPPELPMPNRERLEAEKELVGVYFSEHPLMQIGRAMRSSVSAFTSDLSEEMNGQMVTLGGMIQSARTIVTKKGDPMAFVQFEDPHGSLELVLFPRVFQSVQEYVHPESLVIAEGKVQVREGKVAVLVERLNSFAMPDEEAGAGEPAQLRLFSPAAKPAANAQYRGIANAGASTKGRASAAGQPESATRPVHDQGSATPTVAELKANLSTEDYALFGSGASDMPSLDDIDQVFGESEDLALEPQGTQAVLEPAPQTQALPPTGAPPAVPPPTPAPAPAALPDMKMSGGVHIPSKQAGGAMDTQGNGGNGKNEVAPPTRPAESRRTAGNAGAKPIPMRSGAPAADAPGQRVHIHIRRSSDVEQDSQRLRGLLRLLTSVQGSDRFYFYIPNENGLAQVDFPNCQTNYAEIADKLSELDEWAHVRVE